MESTLLRLVLIMNNPSRAEIKLQITLKRTNDTPLSTPWSDGLDTLAQQSLTRQILKVLLLIIERGVAKAIHGELLEEYILFAGEIFLLLEHCVLLVDGRRVGIIALVVIVVEAVVGIIHVHVTVVHHHLRVRREVIVEVVIAETVIVGEVIIVHGGVRRLIVHEVALHKSSLLLLSCKLLTLHSLLVFKQDLLHLGSALSKSLGGLLASTIVTDFEPEAKLLVFLEETAVHLADGANDGA